MHTRNGTGSAPPWRSQEQEIGSARFSITHLSVIADWSFCCALLHVSNGRNTDQIESTLSPAPFAGQFPNSFRLGQQMTQVRVRGSEAQSFAASIMALDALTFPAPTASSRCLSETHQAAFSSEAPRRESAGYVHRLGSRTRGAFPVAAPALRERGLRFSSRPQPSSRSASLVSSRFSQIFAILQSLMTVFGCTPNAAAVSSTLMPPK
jgi:hypothetical protein